MGFDDLKNYAQNEKLKSEQLKEQTKQANQEHQEKVKSFQDKFNKAKGEFIRTASKLNNDQQSGFKMQEKNNGGILVATYILFQNFNLYKKFDIDVTGNMNEENIKIKSTLIAIGNQKMYNGHTFETTMKIDEASVDSFCDQLLIHVKSHNENK